MAEIQTEDPAETRGGEKIDWARARPGQPLPELPGDDDRGVEDRDLVPLPASCGLPGCGSD